jgi:hypothetical protein
MTAVLAILVVLVPACVTLIGYWIQRQAGKRLELQKVQENARLRLDSVMRAAELLTSSGDAVASRERSVAALLALTQLDYAALAIGLLADFWSMQPSLSPTQENAGPSSSISADTAILVIKAALMSKEPTAQLMAAELLARKAGTLDINSPLHWPDLSRQWVELSTATKFVLVDALIFMAIAREASENSLRTLAIRLYGIWEVDQEPRVKRCTGAFIRAILPSLKRLRYTIFVRGLDQGAVTIDAMGVAADSATPDPDEYFEMIVERRSLNLREWSESHESGLSAATLAPRERLSEANRTGTESEED